MDSSPRIDPVAWVPKTMWKCHYDSHGKPMRWYVRIEAPEGHQRMMKGCNAEGATPSIAINQLRDIVSWWLDWDNRRGGKTAAEHYPQIPKDDPRLNDPTVRYGKIVGQVRIRPSEPPF